MTTVDGWLVLEPTSTYLHAWDLAPIPRRITLHTGSPGFLLAHLACWFHNQIERLDQPGEHPTGIDDGGYAKRAITGGSTPTKHQTGCAEDLNWRKHPYNVPTLQTFTPDQVNRIRRRLDHVYEGVIEWGGNWPSHPGSTAKTDAMHFQIAFDATMTDCERVGRKLLDSPNGRRLLKANPGQKAVILS